MPQTRFFLYGLMLTTTVAGSICCQSAEAANRSLAHQLGNFSEHILEELNVRRCQSVGVLKFQIIKPGQAPTDNAGPLNTFLADRLEAALVMAAESHSKLKIVRNASAVAATIEGASYLSPHGREQLYTAKYPVAYGDERVEVDLFLTGVAKFAPDYKSFQLGIFAAEAGASSLKLLVQFEVDADGQILHEIGESFQLRGAGSKGIASHSEVQIRQVHESPEANYPLQDDPAIQLLIFYDGQPVNLEFRQGAAWIPEPREGQEVTFHLERLDSGGAALGAVLKINGENTLYRQRLRDFRCAKWIFPEKRAYEIRGFQRSDHATMERFRVASVAESRDLEMHFGPDVGTISLIVFQESQQARKALKQAQEMNEPDIRAIADAAFPEQTPPDVESLRAQLRRPLVEEKRVEHAAQALTRSAKAETQVKGLLAAGRKERHKVQVKHDFTWHPVPVLSAVIHYYSTK